MQVVALAAQATTTLRTHELGASGVRVLFTFETLANGGILFGLLVAVGAAGVVSLPNSSLFSNPGGCRPAASTPTFTTPLASHSAVSVRSGPVSLVSTAVLAFCLASAVPMGVGTETT